MRRERSPLARDLRRAGRLLVVPAVAFGFVLAFTPGRTEIAIRVFALILSAAVLLLAVASLRRAFPPAAPLRPKRRRERPSRDTPESLARLEARTTLGAAGAFDLHYRLRPRLRELASELLAARRGVALDAEPGRARAVLGEEAWELVREDRPPPEDRLARGVPIRDLDRVVESLERI